MAITTTTSDHAADIDRHVRIYITVFVALMVLTIITVAISRLHLPVPIAVTVALLVATIKGTLVACYFMHLISEKKLIYAVLAADRCLLRRAAGPSRPHPQQRLLDSRSTEHDAPERTGHESTSMNLRWFHALLILLSAALAVLFGVWCLGQYGRDDGVASLVAAIAAFAVSFGLVVYDSWFLRKTRTLR